MSSPPPPPPLSLPQPPPPSHLPLLPFSTTTATTTISSGSNNREYRKGNWTIQETLTLITAKKLDDERRSKPSSTSSKPGELRWKWVENYCWAHGCFRSQNQCNDKWDNLLRDFKKVRDYQSRSSLDNNNSLPSYWTMERNQRKYYNLPSNMSFEVFQALNEVVQRRCHTTNIATITLPPPPPPPPQSQEQQQYVSAVAPPPPQDPVVTAAPEMDAPAISEGSESSATESSDKQHDTGSKRRKVRNVGASIKHSASILANTIRNCEDKKDKRHQELMEFEQRRLQLEETRNEVSRQGMANLVLAVTKLSTAIQSLISSDHQT